MNLRINPIPVLFSIAFLFVSIHATSQNNLKIGWSQVDVTPDKPVLIAGQFHARVSEDVLDPITATVLVLESGDDASTSTKVVFVSCDLVGISDGTRDEKEKSLLTTVRRMVSEKIPEIAGSDIIINATHSHSAPYCGTETDIQKRYGIALNAMSPYEYLQFMAGRVAAAVSEAWSVRKPGGVSYGTSHAVVGHNRLQSYLSGKSRMYGNTNDVEFSHIEGFEDHSVNLIYTWDRDSRLTGVVMNVACPSQVSEHEYRLSADYWHDVRGEIAAQLGEDVFVLPQCSAAGDQSPHFMYDQKSEERMQSLMFPDEKPGRGSIARRKQIARDLTHAAVSILPYMKDNIAWDPVLEHQTETLPLTRRLLNQEDLSLAAEGMETWKPIYDSLLLDLTSHPEKMKEGRWYTGITQAYSRYRWFANVETRFNLEQKEKTIPIEVHTIRLGDIALATNPFELYLDYGVRMKTQSPAVQTFLIQLAGSGSYVPTVRSIAGGAYGAVASSTLIGPEGGQELVGHTLRMLRGMWTD